MQLQNFVAVFISEEKLNIVRTTFETARGKCKFNKREGANGEILSPILLTLSLHLAVKYKRYLPALQCERYVCWCLIIALSSDGIFVNCMGHLSTHGS